MPAGRTADGDSSHGIVVDSTTLKTHLKSAADFRTHRERDLCYTYAVSGSRRNLVSLAAVVREFPQQRSFFLSDPNFLRIRPSVRSL